jgi:hypothetical protein
MLPETRFRVLLACLAVLACTALVVWWRNKPAQSATNAEPPNEWSGSFRDIPFAKSGAPPASYITSQVEWEKLWRAWRGSEELPTVDFEKDFVFVGTVPGADSQFELCFAETPKGVLIGGPMPTSVETWHPRSPGFAYQMVVRPRKGFKTFYGMPLEEDAASLPANTSLKISHWRSNLMVENGAAYDKAVLVIGDYKQIFTPYGQIVRTDEKDKIVVKMKKSLGFFGHPPEPMSIRQLRNAMGCAVYIDNKTLTIATYGDWNSYIEGRSWIETIIEIPKDSKFEGTSHSIPGVYRDLKDLEPALTKMKTNTDGCWLLPDTPKVWHRIPAVPMSPDEWEAQSDSINKRS